MTSLILGFEPENQSFSLDLNQVNFNYTTRTLRNNLWNIITTNKLSVFSNTERPHKLPQFNSNKNYSNSSLQKCSDLVSTCLKKETQQAPVLAQSFLAGTKMSSDFDVAKVPYFSVAQTGASVSDGVEATRPGICRGPVKIFASNTNDHEPLKKNFSQINEALFQTKNQKFKAKRKFNQLLNSHSQVCENNEVKIKNNLLLNVNKNKNLDNDIETIHKITVEDIDIQNKKNISNLKKKLKIENTKKE